MKLTQAWKEKGYAVGTMLSELYSPNVAELFAQGGLDFFIIDCEHGSFDYSMVASMAAVAQKINISALVRVPTIGREYILKVLEMGAQGIMVPMVKSAEDVRKVVEYARYAPVGARGISTRRAHNHYDAKDIPAYMQKANKETVILIQIETKEALEALDEIVAVPGIDGLIIGPSDLSAALGDFGNVSSMQFQKAVNKVLAATKAAGLHCGFVTSNVAKLKECQTMGMDTLSWDSEIGMILSSTKNVLKTFRDN